jgi:hypothetical protein
MLKNSPGQSWPGLYLAIMGTAHNLHSIFTRNAPNSPGDGKQFPSQRIGPAPLPWNGSEAELVMNSRITDNSEQIDRKTSRSICDAIGERLQQNLRPESSRLSSQLQHLMDELRKRDSEDRLRSSH